MGSINWDDYIRYDSISHRYHIDEDGLIRIGASDKMISYLQTRCNFRNRELERKDKERQNYLRDKQKIQQFKRIKKYISNCEKHGEFEKLSDEAIYAIIDKMQQLMLSRDPVSVQYKNTLSTLHLYMKTHNREIDETQLSKELLVAIRQFGICAEQVEIWYLMNHDRKKKYYYEFPKETGEM